METFGHSLTVVEGKVDPQVHVLCPHVVGGLGVEDGVDAAVQVGLAGRLTAPGHGDDGRPGTVPGQQVGGPVRRNKANMMDDAWIDIFNTCFNTFYELFNTCFNTYI